MHINGRLQTWYNFIIPYEKHLRSRRCRISKVWYKKVSTVVNLWLLIQISSCVLCFDPTKIISCLNKNLWRRYKLSRISEIRRLCVCPIQRQKTSLDEKSRTIGLYKLENLVVYLFVAFVSLVKLQKFRQMSISSHKRQHKHESFTIQDSVLLLLLLLYFFIQIDNFGNCFNKLYFKFLSGSFVQ